MSRATVSTTSQSLLATFRRNGWLLAFAPLVLFAACSGDDDNGGGGGTSSNPPPSTPPPAAAQNAYVISGIGEIQAYRVDNDGNLTAVGTPIATGTNPHHVAVDAQGRYVYVSNHESPFLSGWRINQDASLAPMNPAPGSPVTGTDPTENQSHSSALDQTGQFLYVVAGPESGAPSTLRAYRVDQTPGNNLGLLTFITGQSFPVGIHAHNITVSPNNQFVYVASEGSDEVFAFSRNTSTGELTPQGTITGLDGASAVVVDNQNRFVYVSYLNAVEVLSIGQNGALTRITPVSTFPTNLTGTGSGPHSMAIHPNGQTLYTANINSNTVTVFRVDPGTGVLTPAQTPSPATGLEPNYVIVHPNGRFLYTADTTADQISRFAINADGTLVTPATAIPAGNGANGIGTTKF